MRVIAVLALDGVIAFDLAIPCQIFGAARLPDGSPAYDVRVCAPSAIAATNGDSVQFGLRSRWRWDDARVADTIIVPGASTFDAAPPRAVLGLLNERAADGVRIASICTGAFILAAAGLLDGRRATTHWQFTRELERRYPEVAVDPDVLYVDNDGRILTSAGLAAGIDLCIYMVGVDYGANVAAAVARNTVVPMVREGGQAQFVVDPARPDDSSTELHRTLEWMRTQLQQPLTLEQIAANANTSVRTLNRHFRDKLGTTPLQWLLHARVQRAQELLETTDLAIERVADEVGFATAVTMRHHFARRVGVPPNRYRAAFRRNSGASAQCRSNRIDS